MNDDSLTLAKIKRIYYIITFSVRGTGRVICSVRLHIIYIKNVLALYVPRAGRITRYESSVIYVLSSICTAVPYSLGFPDLSRRSWQYTVYFRCVFC